jgi:hypothetical protein
MPLGEKSVRNKIKNLSIEYRLSGLREILMELVDRIEGLEEKMNKVYEGCFKDV